MRRILIATMTVWCSFGASGGLAHAQPPTPAFYAAAGTIRPQGALGQIVAEESIPTPVAGARAWRIAYISSDVAGHKTIVTGLVVAPVRPPPAAGRPIMAWAHGTTGTAENCGPSQVLDPAQGLNEYFLLNGDSWTDYGLPNVEAFIKEGYVVVGTDYQGLGGGGRHQYAVAASQARDVIDSIRAAGSIKATGAGKKAIVYGWSQGGGATLAAASLPDYIARQGTASDSIQILGFVALAPFDTAVLAAAATPDQSGSEKLIADLTARFSDNVFNFTHFAMNMWGTQAALPACSSTTFSPMTGRRSWTGCYEQVHACGRRHPQLWVRFRIQNLAEAQADQHARLEVRAQEMCMLGANVERVQLAGEQTHFSTPGAAAPLYLPWVRERVAGRPPANGCPVD